MNDKKCRHNDRRRRRMRDLNSCVAECLDCGMLYAMIAGKTVVSRKWVDRDDPRVGFGTWATLSMLDNERSAIRERLKP